MKIKTLITGGIAASALALAGGALLTGTPNVAQAAPKPCSALVVGPIKDKCAHSGFNAVKVAEKAAMDAHNASGPPVLVCTSCHTNQTDFNTKPNAAADWNAYMKAFFH